MPTHHTHYQNSIPAEIEKNLIELYQSAFSVKECFYKDVSNINVLVIYNNNILVHILFYKLLKKEVVVLNEFFDIEDEYVKYFAEYVFNKYKKTNTIHFNKINTKLCNCTFPFKIWSISNDIIIQLPETIEEYLSRLGKKTKKTLRYCNNKLNRKFNDFSISVHQKESIDPEVISIIVNLNRIRMKDLKLTSVFDSEFERKIKAFSKKYGIVVSIKINGQIVAGAVCYEVGSHSYGEIIAYDQAYTEYRIGMICAYSMIKTLIERGIRVFHMGIGEKEYKYRLGGTRKAIYTTSIFRTRVHKLIGLIKYFNKYHYVIKVYNEFKYRFIEKVKYTFLYK